jgi:hypothetical protein
LRWFPILAVATAFLTIANGALAQQRFRTPDEAVAALINAARASSPALLMRVLGPGSDEIVSSGDPVADAFARKRLLDAYNIRHQIVREGKDHAVLVIGQEEWPLPIPLMRYNNTWRFDAQVARRELVFRRIGRNEQSAIQACLLYVKAQREYANKGFGGKGVYAQRVVSQLGEKDGLYWPALSRTRARSVSSPPLRRRRDIQSKINATPIMVTVIGFSPGKGRMRLAAKSTTWCTVKWLVGSRSWPIRRSTAIPA